MKKFRVGFLVDNLHPSTYVNEVIEFVDQSNDFDRPIIITGYKRPPSKKSIFQKLIDKARQGPNKFLGAFLWYFLHQLIRNLEEKTAKRVFPKYLSNYEIKNIDEQIKSKGLKKSFIIEKLNISKKTFYARMKTKTFKPEEVSILKSLGLG